MLRLIRDCLVSVVIIGLALAVFVFLAGRLLPLTIVVSVVLVFVSLTGFMQIRNKFRYGMVLERKYVQAHTAWRLGICSVPAPPGAIVIPGRPLVIQTVPDEWLLLIENDYGLKHWAKVTEEGYDTYPEGKRYERYRL